MKGIANFDATNSCMNKTLIIACFLLISARSLSQKINSSLQLNQGEVYEVTLELNTSIAQQAMGQAIDFSIEATGTHSFRITNSTPDNSTLNHTIQKVIFSFDGMGQKRKFDSGNEKDMNGPFGKPIKELLEKKYDMIIDPAGTALMVVPEKITFGENDTRMAIISNMMKDVFNLAKPPQKGAASFFKILPDTALGVGEPWMITHTDETGKTETIYNITTLNDSIIIVDFKSSSVTVTRAEMMGNPTTTTMNSKSAGTIRLDRVTGIIQEKKETIEATGNTETSFGNLPVTSKTTTLVTVKKTE